MTALARADVAARILRLPPEARDRSIELLKQVQFAKEKRGAVAHAKRDYLQRRRYAGDPWAYYADIFGVTLTAQQNHVLGLLNTEPLVLIPSGNNLGKTFLLAGWGIYRFDALGALENPDTGEREQGARCLLPGPDHLTVFKTVYSQMLVLAARAERRGHLMPGERSDRSVMWSVRPMWDMEAFSPPTRVEQNVAHTASGRHHRNQYALIEEGQGVAEPVWRATEGMCSSRGNQIVSSFNPTEPVGAAFQRARDGVYVVTHLSAFEHPNVQTRELVVPDAIDFVKVDGRVRSQCRDRGTYPETRLEPEFRDFVYALPPHKAEECGPRKDGILGHPFGEPRVYRPNGTFTAQGLGQWPADSDSGLFNAGDLDLAMTRWRNSPERRVGIPNRVGVDPAREGVDDTCAVPAWGDTVESLLRAYVDVETQGEAGLELFRKARRQSSGMPEVIPKGDGVDVAQALHRRWPQSPFNIDSTGVGSSPLDHLNRVLHRDVYPVVYSAKALPPLPGEPYSVNKRTQLFVRASMLVARQLADVPDDPQLREELLAHYLEPEELTVEQLNRSTGKIEKIRVPAVNLCSRDDIKKQIGRSPDRANGWALSLAARPAATHVIRKTNFRFR